MSEPKRHHVVPQFYLERFARDGDVELVAKDDPAKVVPTGVAAVLAYKHFYTIDSEKGRDTIVEKDLFAKRIEGPPLGGARDLYAAGSLAAAGIGRTNS